jgi:hydrogenase-4 component B
VSPGLPLLTAAGLLGAAMICGGRWPRLWLALTVAGAAAALGAALLVLCVVPDWECWGAITVGGERPHVRLDALSALFLALLSVVGAAGALYAREYWPDRQYPASAPRGRVWWSSLVLCMGLVLTLSNGLHFLIAW